MSKITLSTFKSFVNKNFKNLWISELNTFDGMIDGIRESDTKGFYPIQETIQHIARTLGIKGAWLVGSSRDWFTKYEDERFVGIEVNNSCRNFIIAIDKGVSA